MFTAAIEQVFQKSNIKKGVDVENETLKDLRFADDVALTTRTAEEMEENLNRLNTESKKVGLKIHKGKTKYMTNYETSKSIRIEEEIIEEVDEYKYLGQIVDLTQSMEDEINARIRAAWSSFGRYKEILTDKELPMSLKRKTLDQCILPKLTYSCETWAFTKENLKKVRTAQRAMERRMLGLTLLDKVSCKKIREKTGVRDALEYILRMKWRWAGHIGRMSDNRWTHRCTFWDIQTTRRIGRPRTEWDTDIVKYAGPDWRERCQDRRQWRVLAEGYIQQWTNIA